MKKIISLLFVVFLVGTPLCCVNKGADAVQEGEAIVDVTAMDLEGTAIGLKEFQDGAPMLLVFFASWCPPCREEVPKLVDIMNTYGSKGLKVLAVSVDNSAAVLPSFVAKTGINYTVWHDESGEAARTYKVMGIPMNILVNKQGTITFRGHHPPTAKDIAVIIE